MGQRQFIDLLLRFGLQWQTHSDRYSTEIASSCNTSINAIVLWMIIINICGKKPFFLLYLACHILCFHWVFLHVMILSYNKNRTRNYDDFCPSKLSNKYNIDHIPFQFYVYFSCPKYMHISFCVCVLNNRHTCSKKKKGELWYY